ncbi:hypothetical protein D3C79_831930 [compost metagenome]
MRPSHAGFQVDPGEDVVVVPDDPGAIAPGSTGGKTIVLAVAAQVGSGGTSTGACDGAGIECLTGIGPTRGWQRAWTVHRVATVAGIVCALQATHMGDTEFTHHGHAAGAHHLVEEMREGGLELGDLLAAIPVQVLPRRTGQQRSVAQRAANGADPGEQNIRGIELHRCVGAVAELAAPGGPGGQCG